MAFVVNTLLVAPMFLQVYIVLPSGKSVFAHWQENKGQSRTCFGKDLWQHGKPKFNEFVDYLNDQHLSIQFTVEMEKEDCLAFLDSLIHRENDGEVYRKHTHTKLFTRTRVITT